MIELSSANCTNAIITTASFSNSRRFMCVQSIRTNLFVMRGGKSRDEVIPIVSIACVVSSRPLKLIAINFMKWEDGEDGMLVYCSCDMQLSTGLPKEGTCYAGTADKHDLMEHL